jgi:hypothetical protein
VLVAGAAHGAKVRAAVQGRLSAADNK